MGKLNVAIADDNQMTLELLGDIVSSDNELQVIGTAKDGEEAYHLIKEKEPDVMLLDVVMPKRMLFCWILSCQNWTDSECLRRSAPMGR